MIKSHVVIFLSILIATECFADQKLEQFYGSHLSASMSQDFQYISGPFGYYNANTKTFIGVVRFDVNSGQPNDYDDVKNVFTKGYLPKTKREVYIRYEPQVITFVVFVFGKGETNLVSALLVGSSKDSAEYTEVINILDSIVVDDTLPLNIDRAYFFTVPDLGVMQPNTIAQNDIIFTQNGVSFPDSEMIMSIGKELFPSDTKGKEIETTESLFASSTGQSKAPGGVEIGEIDNKFATKITWHSKDKEIFFACVFLANTVFVLDLENSNFGYTGDFENLKKALINIHFTE